MRKINFNRRLLKGADLYVVRINSDDNFILSKPCERCQFFCMRYEIRNVYYS